MQPCHREAFPSASILSQQVRQIFRAACSSAWLPRAAASQPEVLLMDQPFDVQSCVGLEDLVRTVWKQQGVLVLFVTHDVDEYVDVGERVIILFSLPTVIQQDVLIHLPTITTSGKIPRTRDEIWITAGRQWLDRLVKK